MTILYMYEKIEGELTELMALHVHAGGTTCRASVVYSIFLHQLALSENEMARHIYLVGGDLATIERLSKVKALSEDCPPGCDDWVLPLVQLWHMSWADLARIVDTRRGVDPP